MDDQKTDETSQDEQKAPEAPPEAPRDRVHPDQWAGFSRGETACLWSAMRQMTFQADDAHVVASTMDKLRGLASAHGILR